MTSCSVSWPQFEHLFIIKHLDNEGRFSEKGLAILIIEFGQKLTVETIVRSTKRIPRHEKLSMLRYCLSPYLIALFMHELVLAEALTASDYIDIVLEKTKQNRTLALTVFKKLFQELPEQLERIEIALKAEEYTEARNITHKLNGSVSFCGLTAIQAIAERLENHLHHYRVEFVFQDFHLLQESVWLFLRFMEVILAELHNPGR